MPLFIFRHHRACLFFLTYVDDIILTGNSNSVLAKFVHSLAARFTLKDLGCLHYVLGMVLIRTSAGMFLSQQNYIRNFLQQFNMADAKLISTPLSVAVSLTLNDGSGFTSAKLYRQLIGALQYVTLTILDICFAVNKLSQFMQYPSHIHWQAAKRFLRYLKHTIFYGLQLQFRSSPTTSLITFTDSD